MMKKLYALLFVLLISISAAAQTAKVVPLSAQHAAEAKRLFDAKEAAIKQWDEFQTRIGTAYLSKRATSVCDGGGGCPWFGGFTFDDTFHFIVPQPRPTSGGISFTPAFSPCTSITTVPMGIGTVTMPLSVDYTRIDAGKETTGKLLLPATSGTSTLTPTNTITTADGRTVSIDTPTWWAAQGSGVWNAPPAKPPVNKRSRAKQ